MGFDRYAFNERRSPSHSRVILGLGALIGPLPACQINAGESAIRSRQTRAVTEFEQSVYNSAATVNGAVPYHPVEGIRKMALAQITSKAPFNDCSNQHKVGRPLIAQVSSSAQFLLVCAVISKKQINRCRARIKQTMSQGFWLCVVVLALFYLSVAGAQYPVPDMVANKVIQKYQRSTCEQLKQKSQPISAKEQEVTQLLRGDPQMRTAFINQVAAPIANRMFECGMIP